MRNCSIVDTPNRADIRTAAFAVAAGRLEVAERRQRLLRAASDRLESLGFASGSLDGAFWDAFRAGLLAAGATDRDIDAISALQVRWIVDTTADPTKRDDQLEMIANHLACTDMNVHLTKLDGMPIVARVDFPDRPTVQ